MRAATRAAGIWGILIRRASLWTDWNEYAGRGKRVRGFRASGRKGGVNGRIYGRKDWALGRGARAPGGFSPRFA
jgi:hypothetical protein